MKNVNKFTVVAILFALFLTNSVLGDNIPTEGKWRDEYYRSADAPLPQVASIEGEAGGTYSFSLAGETSGQYQVVLLHQLGHLTGNFTLE